MSPTQDDPEQTLERKKIRLETEKLSAEIRELKRPWIFKGSNLTTIAVAIIGGLIAFGTDVLKSNVVSLIATRASLERENEGMKIRLQKLINDAEGLSTRLAGCGKMGLH